MEKPLRLWRVSKPEQGPGLFVWFDPETERLTLRDLTEAEKSDTLDKLSSVSGLIRFDSSYDVLDGCKRAVRGGEQLFLHAGSTGEDDDE